MWSKYLGLKRLWEVSWSRGNIKSLSRPRNFLVVHWTTTTANCTLKRKTLVQSVEDYCLASLNMQICNVHFAFIGEVSWAPLHPPPPCRMDFFTVSLSLGNCIVRTEFMAYGRGLAGGFILLLHIVTTLRWARDHDEHIIEKWQCHSRWKKKECYLNTL